MKCPKCFTENSDDSKFCRLCGAGIACSDNTAGIAVDSMPVSPAEGASSGVADENMSAASEAQNSNFTQPAQSPYMEFAAKNPYQTPYAADQYNAGYAPAMPNNYPPAGMPRYNVSPQYMPPYQRPGDRSKNWKAISGMICGIASVPLALTAFGGLFTAVAGIILSGLGLKSSRKGMAIAGLCCAIFGVLLSVIMIISTISLALDGGLNY